MCGEAFFVHNRARAYAMPGLIEAVCPLAFVALFLSSEVREAASITVL